jgi:hypothetical protein
MRNGGEFATIRQGASCSSPNVCGQKNGRAVKRGQFNREETPEGLIKLRHGGGRAIEKS